MGRICQLGGHSGWISVSVGQNGWSILPSRATNWISAKGKEMIPDKRALVFVYTADYPFYVGEQYHRYSTLLRFVCSMSFMTAALSYYQFDILAWYLYHTY
jgi:hypothetical protein